MESTMFGFVPLVVAVALLFAAFRAHERYWALGFMGWRKVYAGLILYLFSGILTALGHWAASAAPVAIGRLVFWQVASVVAAAAGIGLVLAGAIERLRELSEERERLEDIRAGFDLFDSLREIAAQPYAFLEILDFSLKEMVRAAGVECGGLWLHNPGKSEWILTGWASMSEKLRQQTESVRGSGTGFDRLAVTHKARLFHSIEEIRLFFPEWEPEGFQSILGLPLATGTVGTPGRQILGAIILADRSPSHFDDDRARRLYAASDYIAAVIAEARITRQLEAARQQLDSTHAEWERDREEFGRQRDVYETRIRDAKAAWEEERRLLEQDQAVRVSGLQAQAREEADRLVADAARQREGYENRIQELTSAWADEKRSLEENLASQVAGIQTRSKEELDRARTEFETRAAAANAAEQERTSQLQQRWEEARRDFESAQARFENERADWARRLDQLNQDQQAERDVARRREEQLTATYQETLAGMQRRIDELQSHLAAEQQTVISEREALRAANQSLTETESVLSAERRAREEAMTEMTARMESDRHNAAQERQTIEQELHATRQLLEEREKQMSAHLVAVRQAASEEHSRYQDTLQTLQDASARSIAELQAELDQARRNWATVKQDLQSTRVMFDERERQFAARIEAESRARRDIEAGHREHLDFERDLTGNAVRELESRLLAERDRCAALEEHIRTLIADRTTSEEEARQELVEQHLSARRQINAVKSRHASIVDRLQAALALNSGEERLAALMRSMADDLPSPAEFFLWQREPDHAPRLIARMDFDLVLHSESDLPAWLFEAGTIPAEGVTRIIGERQWDDIEQQQEESHCEQWHGHWGNGRKPTWVACWPWRIAHGGPDAEFGYTTGWLTAFGFGPLLIDDEQLGYGSQWVGSIAAAVLGMFNTPDASLAIDELSEPGVAASGGELPEEPPVELNNVILDWAAGQTEDALRLDLSARSQVSVDRTWLRHVLDRGRRLCRGGEPEGGEFSVSTESHNGHTLLRLVRSSGESELTLPDLMAVADADLTSLLVNDSGSRESGPVATSPEPGAMSARWLVRDGRRVGLELQFDSAGADGVIRASNLDPASSRRGLEVVAVNFHNAMSELVVGMLEALGHRVRSLDIAAAPDPVVSEEFDLAIVSATPDQTGWEFARWVKSTMPALPLIVVSDDVPATPDGAICDQMLRIPFQIEELEEAITGLTARAEITQARE